MARNIRAPKLTYPTPPPLEQYDITFSDWQEDRDRAVWRGTQPCGEFPHNAGAIEEKVDKLEKRKIVEGPEGLLY